MYCEHPKTIPHENICAETISNDNNLSRRNSKVSDYSVTVQRFSPGEPRVVRDYRNYAILHGNGHCGRLVAGSAGIREDGDPVRRKYIETLEECWSKRVVDSWRIGKSQGVVLVKENSLEASCPERFEINVPNVYTVSMEHLGHYLVQNKKV